MTPAYELADFHPETGHLHACEAPASCECAAWLYCLASTGGSRPCPYGDSACPCQDVVDGRRDPCHYEGDDPMTPPNAPRESPAVELALAVLRRAGWDVGTSHTWGVERGAGFIAAARDGTASLHTRRCAREPWQEDT